VPAARRVVGHVRPGRRASDTVPLRRGTENTSPLPPRPQLPRPLPASIFELSDPRKAQPNPTPPTPLSRASRLLPIPRGGGEIKARPICACAAWTRPTLSSATSLLRRTFGGPAPAASPLKADDALLGGIFGPLVRTLAPREWVRIPSLEPLRQVLVLAFDRLALPSGRCR
jgi:hypothetical protein